MNTLIDLSLIVAMTPERVIGRNNDLPWGRMPSDMKRFRSITTEARTVILGYNTYASILSRNGNILPGRRHIVVSRQRSAPASDMIKTARTVEEACAAAAEHGTRACVIGGAQIYALFLPLVQRIFITTVFASVQGDAHFPETPGTWHEVCGFGKARWNERDEYDSSFKELQRA